MLLGRIHTLTFWHVCAPKPQEEIVACRIKRRKSHCCMQTQDCCEREPIDLKKKKKKTACKVISCSRNKQIVNESRWIPWTLLNTWNSSAALDLTSSPSYLACRMNFVCQNNLTLYCKSLLNTDGDFPVAQKSAKKKGKKSSGTGHHILTMTSAHILLRRVNVQIPGAVYMGRVEQMASAWWKPSLAALILQLLTGCFNC